MTSGEILSRFIGVIEHLIEKQGVGSENDCSKAHGRKWTYRVVIDSNFRKSYYFGASSTLSSLTTWLRRPLRRDQLGGTKYRYSPYI